MAILPPYSSSLKAGHLLFVAGHIGLDPKTKELPKGIQKQTEQTIQNIINTMEKDGVSLKDVVKTTIFLAHFEDYDLVNEIYAKFFKPPYPTRSTLAVSTLPRNALIEIECIAKLKSEECCGNCSDC